MKGMDPFGIVRYTLLRPAGRYPDQHSYSFGMSGFARVLGETSGGSSARCPDALTMHCASG